jgi:hypothetical protein
MFLKAIAQSWAESKLEKETARTQLLIRELDDAKAEANKRVEAKRSDYSRKIKAHQEKRNKELKIYIGFMNDQLESAGASLPELHNFQKFAFSCVDSWLQVDLCQQEINIIYQKLKAIYSTIGLLDAYMSELTKQLQRQGRKVWRDFTAARELTVVNDFVDSAKRRIERTSKSSDNEFKNELYRLQSHRASLYKEANALRAELSAVFENKIAVDEKHVANKNALAQKYDACVDDWNAIAKKFETFYAHQPSDNRQVNDWLKKCVDGGTLPEIIETIVKANEIVNDAYEVLSELNDEYQPYKRRVQAAHDTKVYPNTFAYDKAVRGRLQPQVREAYENKTSLVAARTILVTRRDELRGYIERIKPLHPDAAIESLCEMLNADREFNTWFAFGFNTKNQRREHWEKKQPRIENATTN